MKREKSGSIAYWLRLFATTYYMILVLKVHQECYVKRLRTPMIMLSPLIIHFQFQ